MFVWVPLAQMLDFDFDSDSLVPCGKIPVPGPSVGVASSTQFSGENAG